MFTISDDEKEQKKGSAAAAGDVDVATAVTEESAGNEEQPPPSSPQLNDVDGDSDVEIVDAAAHRREIQVTTTTSSTSASIINKGKSGNNVHNDESDDDELQVVGTANEMKLPHNRQNCLQFRYNRDHSNNSSNNNAKFCQLCYCYICDKPASECTDWYLGEKGFVTSAAETDNQQRPEEGEEGEKKMASRPSPPPASSSCSTKIGYTADAEPTRQQHLEHHKNHCNATDQGSLKNLWKNMRNAIKNGHDPSIVSNNNSMTTTSMMDSSLAQFFDRYTVPSASSSSMTARQQQQQRHQYRAHATGRGGAHQRRQRTVYHYGGDGIYDSVSMNFADAIDFSSSAAVQSSSSQPRIRRRRARPEGGRDDNNTNERSRHSNHRDRMRTQAILEDLYS